MTYLTTSSYALLADVRAGRVRRTATNVVVRANPRTGFHVRADSATRLLVDYGLMTDPGGVGTFTLTEQGARVLAMALEARS